jgi:hypothetical protein
MFLLSLVCRQNEKQLLLDFTIGKTVTIGWNFQLDTTHEIGSQFVHTLNICSINSYYDLAIGWTVGFIARFNFASIKVSTFACW